MGIMLHRRSNSISTSPTACNFGLPASETERACSLVGVGAGLGWLVLVFF